MRRALKEFGPVAYYGLRSVELVPAPAAHGRVVFGSLLGPGRIVLHDQPRSPWRVGATLTAADRRRFVAAGAHFDRGCIAWPAESLRRFMLEVVLAHELGHHIQQHERRLRGERAARTRDHETRADSLARGLRARTA